MSKQWDNQAVGRAIGVLWSGCCLDKWDLKEWQDKYAFMEKCVNDPDVCKVLIICDKSYTEKANNRLGGVGDETSIISPEIYGKTRACSH